ncbi:MAG: hypothetical protein EBQ84_14365 [Betaproteobacteria bacterium]|nr:hypothetical protein [Betaproteobacteria bacterium]
MSWVLGAALQLQQSSLWALEIDWLFFGVASIVFIFSLRFFKNILKTILTCITMMLISIALINLCSYFYLKTALEPTIECVDVMVQGMVTHIPKKMKTACDLYFK